MKRDGATNTQPASLAGPAPVTIRSRMAGKEVRGAAKRGHHTTSNDDLPPNKKKASVKKEKEATNGGGGTCKRLSKALEPQQAPQKPGETPKLTLKRNTKSALQHTETVKRARSVTSPAQSVVAEEKDTRVSQDFNTPPKLASKLPVPGKPKLPDEPPLMNDDKKPDMTKLRVPENVKLPEDPPVVIDEAKTMPPKANESGGEGKTENPINLALAHRIEELQAAHERLLQENSELREELDLMEFRMLEMDTSPKRAVSRGSETRFDITELDDVSDSGVMSLPTSEDDPQEYGIEGEREKDVKWRLMEICRGVESVADRICLQQAMALIRHQEARLEGMEATIAAISHEARNGTGEIECKRIVATVPPFSEPRCLEESGVFLGCEFGDECGGTRVGATRGTQTEATWGSGDLSQELRKLSRVRERIEERGAEPKEVIFYRERVEALEHRLQVFESSGDTRVRALAKQVQRETLLEAKVKQLNQKVSRLEADNRRLDEERCELEEAENDTRLRCQKLELKLSTLGEKKTALKVQLEEATIAMSQLRSSLEAEEKKKNEARLHASRMEALVHSYEEKNLELEEREMEVRYRLQMLENTMPAIMMWNMWKMMGSVPAASPSSLPGRPEITQPFPLNNSMFPANPPGNKEEELLLKLQMLEKKLTTESQLLEESRKAEDALQDKIKTLEHLVNNKDKEILDFIEGDPEKDVEVFEKLTQMARERLQMDKRIKDLELKEKLYQETLQQADTMFAEMEGGYAQKIKMKDEQLEKREAMLAENESKLKLAAEEITAHLQEKIDSLEVDIQQLKDLLSKREREREALETEEKRLYKELQDSLLQLEDVKKNVEGPLRSELEAERKKNRTLEEAIQKMDTIISSKDEMHECEVSTLKRQITRLNRDMLENEVTISELKEEVQTLEAALSELRANLYREKEQSEDKLKQMEAKLEKKDKEFEDLKAALGPEGSIKEKSIKEELEEEEDREPDVEGDSIFSQEMIDQEIASAKGIYLGTSVEDLVRSAEKSLSQCRTAKPEEQKLNERETSLTSKEMVSEPNELKTNEIGPTVGDTLFDPNAVKSRSCKELIAMLNNMEKAQPMIEFTSTDARGGDSASVFLVTPDCLIAQNAVSDVNGKDLKSTVDNLSRAYNHSKMQVNLLH